jgi:hypothetical protein
VRWNELSLYLSEIKPHVVHFAGHGDGSNGLVFHNDDGTAHPVSGTGLAHLLHTLPDNVRCVVLNACWSEAQATAIGKHIDFVIGMTAAIPDAAAIRFAAGFYRGIGFGRDVRTAFELGRSEMGIGEGGDGADRDIVTVSDGTKDVRVATADLPRLVVREGADATTVLLGRG